MYYPGNGDAKQSIAFAEILFQYVALRWCVSRRKIVLNIEFSHRIRYIILASILAAGLVLSLHMLWTAYKTNGGFGFPLDDAWIHLQFAKNLHDYGAFSYYKNEMTTAGSTSPLYTFLLALGFFLISHELILSYILGIVSLLAAGMALYLIALQIFDDNSFLAFGAALLLMLESRMHWMALAGMETTLFTALLLVVLYFFYEKKPLPFGICSGLLLWARPDAVILYGVIAISLMYEVKWVKHPVGKKQKTSDPGVQTSWIKKSYPYFLSLITAYAVLNLYLSGSLLPNTYAAKLKYYADGGENFPAEVLAFLTDGHFLIPSMLAAVSLIGIGWKIFKRQSTLLLIPALWSLFLFLAYWKNLPKLYQNGRYLIPLLPTFLLLSMDGLQIILGLAKKQFSVLKVPRTAAFVQGMFILLLAGSFCWKAVEQEKTYAMYCKHISDRQVKTARWIADNISEHAIIATHDIGAIAYYSGRRVVDMVGLVSPAMIDNIGSFNGLMKFLIHSQATHVATLKNWFEIVNVNPLFTTEPGQVEVMGVFPFDPLRTHFTPQDAMRLNDLGERYLASGSFTTAAQIFRQSFQLDPQSARTEYLLAKSALLLGDTAAARRLFDIVLQIQHDYPGIPGGFAHLGKENP